MSNEQQDNINVIVPNTTDGVNTTPDLAATTPTLFGSGAPVSPVTGLGAPTPANVNTQYQNDIHVTDGPFIENNPYTGIGRPPTGNQYVGNTVGPFTGLYSGNPFLESIQSNPFLDNSTGNPFLGGNPYLGNIGGNLYVAPMLQAPQPGTIRPQLVQAEKLKKFSGADFKR